MIVTHKFNLDLVKRELPPRIDVMQDDKYSRNLEIQLMANGKAYYPPDGCRVLIRYSKVDCTGGAYDVLPDGTEAWTIEDNVITVRLAPQVCTKNGPVKMIVTLFSGNSELNCFGLDLFVWKNPKGIYPSSRYVNVTGFIPQPASANVGQYLEVAAVDGSGRITALQAVDAPEGGTAEVVLPENIVTADLMGAEGTDSDTVPVNADTLGGVPAGDYARSFFTAFLPESVTFPTSLTAVALAKGLSYGDFFDVQDGTIVCLKKCIANISVQGYADKGFTSGDLFGIALWKNGTLVSRDYNYAHANNSFKTFHIGPMICEIQPGDVFQLLANNAHGARGVLMSGATYTYLTIQILRDLNTEVTE